MPTPEASPGAPIAAFRPSVMFVAYYVADVERALSFYVGFLGMTEQLRFPIGNGVIEIVLGFPDVKGSNVILMWDEKRSTPYKHGDAYNRIVIRVSDVNAATAAARARGIPIVNEPADAPGLRFSIVRDPDGFLVEFLELKRA